MKNSFSALDFFSAKLAYEITPEDLATAQAAEAGPIVVDTRPAAAWRESRILGAVTIPFDDVTNRAFEVLDDEDADIVVYAWGVGDHTAARAAVALLKLGYTQVRELTGGIEAWQNEGFALETDGRLHQFLTELDAPMAG
jgi:rhodanese-related sulfurtransferase